MYFIELSKTFINPKGETMTESRAAKNEAIKAKMAELREAEERKDKRTRIITLSVIVAAVAVVIGLVVFILSQAQDKNDNGPVIGEQKIPSSVDENGAFPLNKTPNPDAKRVDIFFDPMCPGCGIVDRAIGSKVSELVDNDEINLYLTPVAFVSGPEDNLYSATSVNAFVTVAEHDPRLALKFMNRIFERDFQPQYADAVGDAELTAIAIEVGVPEDVAKSFSNRTYSDWVKENSTKQMARQDLFADGFSTPSVFVGLDYVDGKASGEKILFESDDILQVFLDELNK